jgi:hypothetical protein
VSDWSAARRALWRGAQLLGPLLLPGVLGRLSDPTSGLFHGAAFRARWRRVQRFAPLAATTPSRWVSRIMPFRRSLGLDLSTMSVRGSRRLNNGAPAACPKIQGAEPFGLKVGRGGPKERY